MLKLRIERTEAIAPPSLQLHPEANVWRDGDGEVLAYAEGLGDEYWMHLPGLASFRFSSSAGDVTATVGNSTGEDLVLDAYRRRVLPMALQVSGWEVMHASAIRSNAGVAALCADSKTGKSTLAFGLGERGYPIWADDLVAFEISEQIPRAISLPFNLRLRSPSIELFKQNGAPLDPIRNNDDPPGKETAPLMAMCVLRRAETPHESVTVRQLQLSEAFAAILAHAWSFGMENEKRKRRMIHNYLDLVATTPVFDVCFQPGVEHLPSVLNALESLIERGAQAEIVSK